jgi:hypothetical protein
MKHPIATTHNGKSVYVDLIYSLAAITISQQPQLATMVKEVLRQTRVDTPTMHIEQDMRRNIGYDYVVETSVTDHVFYAKLLRDTTYTRFVKNGKPKPTQFLSMILHCDADGDYELKEAWIGKQHPIRPTSAEDATPESLAYWDTHAFALEGLQLQARSLTRTCPYLPAAPALAETPAPEPASEASSKNSAV